MCGGGEVSSLIAIGAELEVGLDNMKLTLTTAVPAFAPRPVLEACCFIKVST